VIQIFLVEDQALVRGALKVLLELEPDLKVIGEAGNGREALSRAPGQAVDVFLLDIDMPEMDGLTAAEQLRRVAPSAKIVMLTTFARPGYLDRAIRLGASGYLLKDTPAGALADAVRRIHAGKRVIDPELAAEALGEPNPLTDRERDVLVRADRGDSGPDIAAALALSPGTVRNYLSTAMDKLGAATRVEAARIAREKGWL
jgi:two-component system, NarL family, response regulator DesR